MASSARVNGALPNAMFATPGCVLRKSAQSRPLMMAPAVWVGPMSVDVPLMNTPEPDVP